MKFHLRLAALVAAAALTLTACGNGGDDPTPDPAPTDETTGGDTPGGETEAPGDDSGEQSFPVTVTDMAGNEVTIESADSVAVTDNRVFQLVADWDVNVTVAARSLMSPNNPLADDESILDTGSHGEPNFEQVVAADPDLIINGYRYASHAEAMQEAAPDAAFVDMNVPEDSEMGIEEYLTESVTLLGEVFGKQAEAQQVVDDMNTAITEAQDAYDPEVTVMGLVTSANEIRYASPEDGRGSSIFFTMVGLTPALDAEGSANHQGDDISIEAIAESDADFFLVLDRDAAVSGDSDSTPALELINGSAALANVPAVENQAIYIMPADFYLTEDILAYTTVLQELTQSFNELQ